MSLFFKAECRSKVTTCCVWFATCFICVTQVYENYSSFHVSRQHIGWEKFVYFMKNGTRVKMKVTLLESWVNFFIKEFPQTNLSKCRTVNSWKYLSCKSEENIWSKSTHSHFTSSIFGGNSYIKQCWIASNDDELSVLYEKAVETQVKHGTFNRLASTYWDHYNK